ncbi:MAG: ATP-binding cassette domain-containing protein [Sulfolobales archaeon]|nr:ATP-binding cassette domain-containing protein [Sulfolobales archaeon]MCX8198637.1 ATP-binding cassette domain-containing protein [Sulfolobales archaeon]MDW8169711.1 ATP-binding cassette domain-containing protein [Desulfurococcaceae archaeon]
MKEAIIVENLAKRYGSIEAVKGISFTVREGEIFGFLGPNGAGKTTTIHILATILKPTSGKATVDGYDIVREPQKVRKIIGIIFQDPSLDEELTGYENLYIHGRLYGLGGQSLRERIEEALKFVELHEYKDKPVRKYSGGMRRRLEIARALIHIPRILFLDEPTIGLDPQTRVHIWEYINELNREYKTTIFLTTHYMDEAEALCSKIAIIDRGRIIALGTVDDLKSRVGSDVVYVKLYGDNNEGICRALQLADVWSCKHIQDNVLALQVEKASEAVPEILKYLEKLKVKVKEVNYRRPTLDDVFIHLTGREIRDSEGGFVDFARMIHRARTR